MSDDGLALASNLPDLPRYAGWFRRTLQFSTMLKLGRAPWKDAEDLAGYSDWVDLAAAKRRPDADLGYRIVRGLVSEVLVAAGGIEREIQALKVAQEFADANTGWLPDPLVPQPEKGRTGFAPGYAAINSAYAAMNALTWIRAVHERIKRNDGEDAGLLAALKSGEPKETIEAEFAKLLPELKDARKFDNYVLHAGGLQGGSTAEFHVREDRTVYFPFPDKPNQKRFFTWEEFTYDQERDALSYFEGKFDAVSTFIDHMLDAFEALQLP